MKFLKSLKSRFKKTDPENDWSSFSTEQLIRMLKREQPTDAFLDLHLGNRIVAEILERMNKQLCGKQ